jgi:hypothetical protein
MKYWRVLIFILLAAALGLMISAAVFNWASFQVFRPVRPEWQGRLFEPNLLRHGTPISMLAALFTLYVTGVMLLFIFPERMANMAKAFSHSWGRLLRLTFLGLLAGILVIMAAVSSALAMGTFPLSLFLGAILFLGGLLGSVALAYQVGHSLLFRAGWQRLSPLVALLLGELLLYSLTNIPIVGLIMLVIFIFLGLGVTIATRFGSGHPWSLISFTEEGKE